MSEHYKKVEDALGKFDIPVKETMARLRDPDRLVKVRALSALHTKMATEYNLLELLYDSIEDSRAQGLPLAVDTNETLAKNSKARIVELQKALAGLPE